MARGSWLVGLVRRFVVALVVNTALMGEVGCRLQGSCSLPARYTSPVELLAAVNRRLRLLRPTS
ncbi:hypothetical protein AKJ09_01958 [Labilithrix luteola]|uniref:Uncharacterized protein n=1 Tax=Labilithrix luteola TaxID=1391654 RepID=A0A0K1PQA2_9BACT|nr:hypothetical protein AKJ09_01958 [Labilithrix luteola]